MEKCVPLLVAGKPFHQTSSSDRTESPMTYWLLLGLLSENIFIVYIKTDQRGREAMKLSFYDDFISDSESKKSWRQPLLLSWAWGQFPHGIHSWKRPEKTH